VHGLKSWYWCTGMIDSSPRADGLIVGRLDHFSILRDAHVIALVAFFNLSDMHKEVEDFVKRCREYKVGATSEHLWRSLSPQCTTRRSGR
jgi:hypothetical protein